jgi:hypothetical protein
MDAWHPKHVEAQDTIKWLWKWKCIKLVTFLWYIIIHCQQNVKNTKHPTSCCQSQLHIQQKLLGIISVNLNATNQLLIIYCAFIKYLTKNEDEMKQFISYIYKVSKKPMIQVGERSCIIFSLSLASSRNWLRLIKICLNETCTRLGVGKHLSGMFHIENGLKLGDAFLPLLFNFVLE